jgi:hypothetical protein
MVLEADAISAKLQRVEARPDFFQVYLPRPDGYREQESVQIPLEFSEWKKISVDLPAFPLALPIRIDPASQPCIIELTGLRLLGPAGEELWRLSDFTASHLQIAGDAVAISRGAIVKVLSDGQDPQILLPPLSREGRESTVRLEASLRVDAQVLTLAKYLGDHLRAAL